MTSECRSVAAHISSDDGHEGHEATWSKHFLDQLQAWLQTIPQEICRRTSQENIQNEAVTRCIDREMRKASKILAEVFLFVEICMLVVSYRTRVFQESPNQNISPGERGITEHPRHRTRKSTQDKSSKLCFSTCAHSDGGGLRLVWKYDFVDTQTCATLYALHCVRCCVC